MAKGRRPGLTRRELIQGVASGLAVTASGIGRAIAAPRPPVRGTRWDTIVVGAGVFGAWTAWHLRERRASASSSSTPPGPPTRAPPPAANRG